MDCLQEWDVTFNKPVSAWESECDEAIKSLTQPAKDTQSVRGEPCPHCGKYADEMTAEEIYQHLKLLGEDFQGGGHV